MCLKFEFKIVVILYFIILCSISLGIIKSKLYILACQEIFSKKLYI